VSALLSDEEPPPQAASNKKNMQIHIKRIQVRFFMSKALQLFDLFSV
jgi:hypothetical protein